jgi:hypothetical protein
MIVPAVYNYQDLPARFSWPYWPVVASFIIFTLIKRHTMTTLELIVKTQDMHELLDLFFANLLYQFVIAEYNMKKRGTEIGNSDLN